MLIEIVSINNTAEIQNITIRERAIQCKHLTSSQYLAFLANKETGFMSFEHREDLKVGIIYEIYVLEGEKHRHKGIGTSLLKLGETLGEKYNCSKLILSPHPFDKTVTEDFLVAWYKKHGYTWSLSANNEMEKTLPFPMRT